MNRTKGFHFSECTRPAEFYLIEEAQKGLKVKGAKMLAREHAATHFAGIKRVQLDPRIL
jgi:aromatic ring hydroxylase